MRVEHISYDEAIECLKAIKNAYFPNGTSRWTETIKLCIDLIEKEKEETLNDLRLTE